MRICVDAWLHYKNHRSFLWRTNFRFHQTSSAWTFSDDSIERLSKRWNVEFLGLLLDIPLRIGVSFQRISKQRASLSLSLSLLRLLASYYKSVILLSASVCVHVLYYTHFIEHRVGNIKLKHIPFRTQSKLCDAMYGTKGELHFTLSQYIYVYTWIEPSAA